MMKGRHVGAKGEAAEIIERRCLREGGDARGDGRQARNDALPGRLANDAEAHGGRDKV